MRDDLFAVVDQLTELVGHIRQGSLVNRNEAQSRLTAALEANVALREVASADIDRAGGIDRFLSQLTKVSQRRLELLRDELARLRASIRIPRTRERFESLRVQAVAELESAASRELPVELPGPREGWVSWWSSLGETEAARAFEVVSRALPHLAELLEELEGRALSDVFSALPHGAGSGSHAFRAPLPPPQAQMSPNPNGPSFRPEAWPEVGAPAAVLESFPAGLGDPPAEAPAPVLKDAPARPEEPLAGAPGPVLEGAPARPEEPAAGALGRVLKDAPARPAEPAARPQEPTAAAPAQPFEAPSAPDPHSQGRATPALESRAVVVPRTTGLAPSQWAVKQDPKVVIRRPAPGPISAVPAQPLDDASSQGRSPNGDASTASPRADPQAAPRRDEDSEAPTGPVTPSDMASGDPAPRSSVTAGAVTVRVPSEFQTRTADQWPRIGGFLEDHWLAPDGAIEPAPWASESFRRELESKLDRAIRGVDLQTAWVLATALERLAIPAVLSSHTIEEISDLLFDRRIPGPDIPRAEKLARLAQADDGSAEARAVVFLESLVGAAPLFPTDSTATRVGYSTQFLKEVVEFALQCRKLGLDPAERLAATTQPAQEMSREQLESKLRETQEELKELVRKNFSAAGGRIQRSHCRKAWTKFMERVTDPLRQAYERPTAQSISALRDLPEKIMQIHREEADRAKARFGDRNSMDRTAAEVSRGVRAVVRALDQLTAAHPDRRPDTPAPPPGLSALAEMPLADPYEDLLRRCVLAVLHPAANAQGQPARLSVRDLRRRPLFLPLAATWIQQGVADDDEVPLSELSAPAVLTTAASLLAQEHRGPALMGLDRLAPHLRRLAMPLLDEAGRDATRRAEGDLRQRIEDFIETLGENAQRLDQLASQGASTVRQLCVEARAALEPRTEREPMLVARWLEQTIGLAAEHLAELENHPATSALRGPAHSNRELRLRETPWRDEGLARWPNAAFALRTLTETKSGVENPHEAKIIAELFGRWSDGILTTAQSNRVLLNRFGGYAFGGVNNFYQEGSGNFAVTVSAQDIRERLRVLERNPSFLPQLAQQFARAVLVAPPEKVTSLRFAVKTADLVSEYPGDLVFVLAPAINAANRRASIMELQQRKLLAAVIDDVDLLRLFNPGAPAPDPLVGAMELALEQQSLDRVNPFDLHDGQSVKMEMFVGRRDEARDLSMTPRYSRLFSGRKLGKSALLRFIQTEKTAQFLPSGNRLSVHYVPIVGAESEQAVVADILGSLEETHGAQPPREGLAAPEKLKATLQAFAQSKPTESLLFVLDESDSFVEEQVAQYDKHREKILAFKMRELESIRDSRGHPRFRFVFAGYRTTSTSEGAWANWGETLILKPLEREDAVRLIAGPLARIGIDASAHADIIAHRCAEQPAVLLRFGQRLLALLAAQRRTDPGKRLPVTRELVSTVFEDMSMQEEIRTVVQNNFQGNDTGRAIFFSALNEFARVVPGAPVSQLDEKIATSLGAMDRDGRWMESGATPETVVRGALRELVHRQLMVEFDNDGVLSWSLKYPHMLPALLQGSPDEQIRRALASSAAGPSSTRTKSFLGRAEIEEMASFLRSVPPEPVAFLVASSWEEPLANSRFGLPDRLGVTPIDASGLARNVLAGRASSVPAVFCGVSADAARILVSSRPRTLPALVLIGGPDLIRWACKVGSSVDGFLLELASPGRVDRARLDWWFRRARGIEFLDASRCLDTIADMTRGVPYLLKIMDSCLLEKPGADGGITLSDHDFDVALRAYEQRVSNLGAQGAGLDLDRRDAELVAIIASASNQLGTDLAKGLLDKELRCDFEPRFAPMDPAVDAERIGRLVALGLLPAKRGAGSALERLEPISEGDPVLRLAGFP